MKSLFAAALALTVIAAGAKADDTNAKSGALVVMGPHGGYNTIQSGQLNNNTGALVVLGPHGGYNTIQSGGHHDSIPFFGIHGFAHNVIIHQHDKPNFIIVPVTLDNGHSKYTAYKKVFFATPEEAEAARLHQQ